MKILLTVIAVMVGMICTAQDTTKVSYLYVYRDGQFSGSMQNYAIFVDDVKACKLSNNKYFKIQIAPGTREISAHKGGMDIGKKETFIAITIEPGKDCYISCDVKKSITRSRLEMEEVTENTGKKNIKKMKEDNCSED